MKIVARYLARYLSYTAAVAAILLLVAIVGLRLWYPNLSEHKGALEGYLSEVVKRPVAIQSLQTQWEGLSPILHASGLRVRRQDGSHSTVRLGSLDMKVNLFALAVGRLEFNSLTLTGPTVAVMRMLDGRLRVGDFISGETTGGDSAGVARWLLQQPSVNVIDGVVVWQDEREPARVLQLSRVNIALSRQHREHRFSGTALLPRDLAEDLKLDGVLKGEPLTDAGFDGTVNARVSGLNVEALPLQLRELAPWLQRGQVDAEVSSSWVAGVVSGAVADIEISEFTVPYGDPPQSLSPHRFASQVSWHHGGDSWRVSFIQPEFELSAGDVLHANQLVLEKVGNARVYNAENVNIDAFVRTVRQLDIDLPWPKLAAHIDPEGVLSSATLTVQGPFLRARDWRFEGQFKDLGWNTHDEVPGATGINGSAIMDGRRGVLTVDSDLLRLAYPRALDETLEFDLFKADLQWSRSTGNWVVDINELLLGNGDLQIEARDAHAEIVEADPRSSFLNATAQVPYLRVDALHRYMPLKLMPDKPREWLQRALVSGIATEGKLEFNGRLSEFPFRSGGGRFHASVRVADGILDYHERWPRLENVNGSLALRNVVFSGEMDTGGIMNSRIAHARVASEDMFVRTRLLKIDGHIDGPVEDIVEFLLRGPFNNRPPEQTLDLVGRGSGTGNVRIELPFTRLKEESRVKGIFRTENAGLVFGSGMEISDISGAVNFTDSTVSGRGLRGRLFDGPVRMDISTVQPRRPPVFAVDAHGRGQPALLSPVLGDKLVTYLAGETEWKGRLEVDGGEASLEVESPLTGAQSGLPPPLRKSAGERFPVVANLEFKPGGAQSVRFELSERLSGFLDFGPGERGLLLDRGQIVMGAGARIRSEAGPGLRVVVDHDRLDADAWIETLESFRDPAQAALPHDDPAREPSLFDAMRALELTTESFILQGRNLGQMTLAATSADSRQWQARLEGESVLGEASASFGPGGTALKLELSRLFWPRAPQHAPAPTAGSTDPARYLALDITAQQFQFAEMTLGELELRAAPEGDSWRVQKLRVEQPAMTIEADGEWVPTQTGQQTRVRSRTTMRDMGDALKRLGFPGHVSGGSADIIANIDWKGSPGAFDFSRLNGVFELQARKGQFLNVEPGSGRLLGLFNVEAFTRRLSLDFSDIFSKGLSFDSISGNGSIRQGDLLSDSLLVVSTAAVIEASGRAGLDTEDYDMELLVAPQVGTNLTLLGALANPAAGAVIFLMQKVFKRQLAEMVHYRYRVSGPWQEPEVVRTAGPADRELNEETVSDAAAEG
jgi:uncharacterized protein (TIGR02099 family)